MFKIIHEIVDDVEAVTKASFNLCVHIVDPLNVPIFLQVAHDVVKEFAADGVVYLELRSTPRANHKTGKEAHIILYS